MYLQSSTAVHNPSTLNYGNATAHGEFGGVPAASKDISISELTIRRLSSAGDIRDMAQLRRQIDLSAATLIDPHFYEHEKKETNWAWSSHSSCRAR